MAISVDFHLNNPNTLRFSSHVLTSQVKPYVVVNIGKGEGYDFQSVSLYCEMEQLDEIIRVALEAKEKLSAAINEDI